jgi:hypothetical protein
MPSAARKSLLLKLGGAALTVAVRDEADGVMQ